eukprot:gb/GECH01003071.1/.p1 GENE.gb/GECH01003071.1/~~gb/GECH01003071.1/.p1  ORF type:complete len:222 (+),score=41.80 gb/GECH01003071.1/:1-666(+)
MLRISGGRNYNSTISSKRKHIAIRNINNNNNKYNILRFHHATRILKESEKNITDELYPTKRTTLKNYKPENIKQRKLPEYESPYSGPREIRNDSEIVDDAELWLQDSIQKEKIFDDYVPEISRGKALAMFLFAFLLLGIFVLMIMWQFPAVDHAAIPLPPKEVYDQLDPASQAKIREQIVCREERLIRQRTEGKLGVSPAELYRDYVKPKIQQIYNYFKTE